MAPLSLPPLPMPPTPFIGREREIAAINAALCHDGVRLLTLTGPGGVGKTRLAIRAAADLSGTFADGICFVPLASIRDPAHVVSTIARTLGLREAGGDPLAERLVALLQPRRLLLLLDNFEQIVDAAPALADLLASCPALTVLVTSRATLRLAGEHVHVVPPLAAPDPGVAVTVDGEIADAVRLFVQTARAADQGFALTNANARTIGAICRRLDGLPLAIELAAARTAALPPAALLLRLERRLPLLTSGPRDAPPRLRAMRDAIAWSYDLLSPDLQALFRRLAVFVGGFTLDAVEAIVSPTDARLRDPFEGITALIDASLVRRLASSDGNPGAAPRYGMLETIREFGLERLADHGEEPAIRRAHAGWFAALAGSADPLDLRARLPALWLDRMDEERENVRAALAWAAAEEDPALSLALAGALWWFWWVRGPVSEGRTWLEQALARGANAPPRLRGAALYALSALTYEQSDYHHALIHASASEAIFRHLGDRAGTIYALLILGALPLDREENVEAAAIFGEAVAIAREIGEDWLLVIALNNFATPLLALGDHAGVERIGEEALTLARRDGDAWGMAYALGNLSGAARERGDLAHAAALCAESLVRAREAGNSRYVADALVGFAAIAAARRQFETAARLVGTADALCQAVGCRVLPHHVQYVRAVETLSVALDPATFSQARQAGLQTALDEAIAEAMPLVTAPESTPLSRPMGLSAREYEVLQLLAGGQTDQQIAGALFISRRTVTTHVGHILAKLDAANRTEAVAVAVRHGLV